MGDKLKVAMIYAGCATLIGLAIWYEVEVWSECRSTNSFMYCMRVLSK